MSDVTLETFLPEVLPWVRDCPEMMARHAVRAAAIEFCTESLWWLDSPTTYTLVSGLNTYELDPPTDADIAAIYEVRVNGRLIEPRGGDELAAKFGFDWRTTTGSPRYYTREQPGAILVTPVPQETTAAALSIQLALTPSRDAQFLDEELWRSWAEDIGYGARARLHEIAGQPFYDATAAAMMRAKFVAAIGKAKAERNAGMGRGPLHIQMPRLV